MFIFLIICIALFVVCPVVITIGLGALGQGEVRRKRAIEDEKARVLKLRGDRLQRDLEVVEQRAHKLSNDVVIGDMKIELMRRQLEALGARDWGPGSESLR